MMHWCAVANASKTGCAFNLHYYAKSLLKTYLVGLSSLIPLKRFKPLRLPLCACVILLSLSKFMLCSFPSQKGKVVGWVVFLTITVLSCLPHKQISKVTQKFTSTIHATTDQNERFQVKYSSFVCAHNPLYCFFINMNFYPPSKKSGNKTHPAIRTKFPEAKGGYLFSSGPARYTFLSNL